MLKPLSDNPERAIWRMMCSILAPLGNYAPAERLIEINLLFSHLERAEVK
jgi:hypothetical protein